MLFNPWGWHIKNNELSETFRYWMVWLHYWRMPLLLFISGAGTCMALGKRSPRQFAEERFKRLVIPLLFGMFVVVPPQIYFEYNKRFEGYWDFYTTVFEFQPYPGGSLSWHHLWFILYLFLYSFIAIPLLIFLRSDRSNRFNDALTKILSVPVVMLVMPAVVMLLTQIVLRPYFPEETHALIDDWAYFVLYLCFFLFGILCYDNQSIWVGIGKNRKYFLWAAIVVLIPFYTFYLHLLDKIELPLLVEAAEISFDVTAVFMSWFTVLALIGFGQHFLNKPHRWLGVVNEGLYPFYILHQTVIIMLGFYLCQLPWNIAAKYWAVCLLTIVSCVLIYLTLIKPFNPIRFLFGMKPIRK